jgi:acetyl-CoA synthetase
VRLSVPKAFLALRGAATPSRETALAVFRFVRQRMAPYQRVRRIEFADLPKTISGKIRRVELRTLEIRRAGDGTRGELEWREEEFPELRGEDRTENPLQYRLPPSHPERSEGAMGRGMAPSLRSG